MEDNNNKIKSRYQLKTINPNFYGKVEVSGEKSEDGIVYVPYIFKEHDEESLKDYNDFMKVYGEKHRCCPECGSESCRMTLMGYPLHSDRRDEYKDLNRCTCTCGSIHTRHDRISIEEFKNK